MQLTCTTRTDPFPPPRPPLRVAKETAPLTAAPILQPPTLFFHPTHQLPTTKCGNRHRRQSSPFNLLYLLQPHKTFERNPPKKTTRSKRPLPTSANALLSSPSRNRSTHSLPPAPPLPRLEFEILKVRAAADLLALPTQQRERIRMLRRLESDEPLSVCNLRTLHPGEGPFIYLLRRGSLQHPSTPRSLSQFPSTQAFKVARVRDKSRRRGKVIRQSHSTGSAQSGSAMVDVHVTPCPPLCWSRSTLVSCPTSTVDPAIPPHF